MVVGRIESIRDGFGGGPAALEWDQRVVLVVPPVVLSAQRGPFERDDTAKFQTIPRTVESVSHVAELRRFHLASGR